MMRILQETSRILAWPLLAVILLYQKTLSPDHGPLLKPFYPYGYCKYHPSCSEYAAITLRTKGIIGLPKIFKRVVSCNPWSMGGVDWPK